MSDGNNLIVNFSHAPVTEVLAGVVYDGLVPESGPFLAAFWHERLRDDFPKVERRPPYVPPEVNLEAPAPAQVSIQMTQGVPPTRLWASGKDAQELIQLQPGFFACNWRKLSPRDTYDHWPARRDAFERWYSAFVDYCERDGLGKPRPIQYEVTYINHIGTNHVWSDHSHAGRIFRLSLPANASDSFEQLNAQFQFAIRDSSEALGRLDVKIVPAVARDGRPVYAFELTARGPIPGQDVGAVLGVLNRGRLAVVRAFLDMTTPEIQDAWGIQ